MTSGMVSIRTSKEKVGISWEARNEVIGRAHDVGSSAGTLIEAFERHGTLTTVSLSHHEKPVLLGILELWLEDVGTCNEPLRAWQYCEGPAHAGPSHLPGQKRSGARRRRFSPLGEWGVGTPGIGTPPPD